MHGFSWRQSDGAARALSYLGLIPFISGALLAWFPAPELRSFALEASSIYAATILSFIGAVHWGRVITAPAEDPLGSLWLIWAVFPSLLGWLATLLPIQWTIPLLILGFLLAWHGDVRAVRAGLLPDWYGRLRNRLTLVVCTALASGLPVIF